MRTEKKRTPTSKEGVFYRRILDVDSKGREKEVDRSYLIRYRVDGRDKMITIGRKSQGVTVAFCVQKLNEAVMKARLGEEIPIKHKKKKRFTFQQGFDDYLRWAKNSKKSWQRDQSLFELHLAPALGQKELSSLTRRDFEKLRDEKLKTLSPRSVEYMLAVARQIINHCIDEGLVSNYQNPIRKRHGQAKRLLPKVDNAKEGFLSYEQARSLLTALKEAHWAAYAFSVVMLFTGARFDEVANLTWQDIDLENGLIHIKPSKNGNPRKVAITPPVAEVLQALESKRESAQSPLIPNSQGKRWDRMPKQWQEVADRIFPKNKTAGRYRVTPHTLRHSHASWMALNGADLLQIKEQLGHRKLDMTLRYSHLIPDRRHDETRKIAAIFTEEAPDA